MGKFKNIIMRAAGVLTAAVLSAGVFVTLPQQAYAVGGSCGSSASWDYSGDTLTISGTGDVSRAAWSYCKGTVKKVVIGDGITSMPAQSFLAYQTLESVRMSDSVTSVGALFCSGCTALKEVMLSANLEIIPNSAFENCSKLSTLTLPTALKTIGNKAFYGNLALTSAELPDGVTTIGASAFMGTNIKTLSIGRSVTTIGTKAFALCCFPSVVFPDSVSDASKVATDAFGVCYDTVVANGDSFTGRTSGATKRVTIIGKPGSAAETYANKANLPFKNSDGSEQNHTHSWSAWTVKTAATCETDGEQIRTCSCGETETQKIDRLGHNYGPWMVSSDPTCTENGVNCRTCSRCGKEETASVPATGHSWGTPQYAWSDDHAQCTASRTCAYCRETEQETKKSSYSVTKQAGVGVPGEGVYTVTFQNSAFAKQTVKVEIPAVDSRWGTPEYTWSADGRRCTATRKEANSGKTESETVDAVYSANPDATCTKKGKAVYTAEFENPAFSAQTRNEDIPAKGHSWSDWTVDVPAGCESDGRESRTCKNCDETELRLTEPTGHSFGEWMGKTPVGCENDGIEERVCANCGKTEQRTVTATGHSFGEWTLKTPAGCETAGIEERKCARCGKTEQRDLWALGHEWGEWKTTRQPTIDNEGVEESKCARCGKTRTQEIPKLTSYVITVTANEGGTVTPKGEIRAAAGSSTTVSFRANNGYRIAAVLLDGESVSQNGSLTIRDLNANHTVSVVFQQNAPQVVRSCIAVSASPKRNVWLADEGSYQMRDFTLIAVISENGQTKEVDITNDCYTNMAPASGNAVTFKYRGGDRDIQSYFSTHGIGCTVPVYLRGDADLNGKVEVEDAMLALKHYVNGVAGKKEELLNDVQKFVTDVDGVEGATLADTTYILRYYTKSIAGLKPTWPEVMAE